MAVKKSFSLSLVSVNYRAMISNTDAMIDSMPSQIPQWISILTAEMLIISLHHFIDLICTVYILHVSMIYVKFSDDLSYEKVREYGQITRTDLGLKCMTELVEVNKKYITKSRQSIGPNSISSSALTIEPII